MSRSERPVLVAGAGLAGLTLALELAARAPRREVVLVDRRTRFERDRTWCAWACRPTPHDRSVSARWRTWAVRAGGRTAAHRGAATPYVHWDARDLYADALERLDRAPNVVLRLGARVTALDPEAGSLVADGERLEGRAVVDARGTGAASWRAAAATAGVELRQGFLGWEVETEHPVFAPDVVELMDFDALPGVRGGVRFAYVLPFAADRALVEDTTIAPGRVPWTRRRAALEELLERRGAGAWRVLREERAEVPMSTRRAPARLGPRGFALGAAGGAIRPSSGYALSRTAAHAAGLADLLADPGDVAASRADGRPGTLRHELLDALFLRAFAAEPGAAPGWFRELVARTPPRAFARFMSDAGGPLDDLLAVLALPPGPFVRALLPELRARIAPADGDGSPGDGRTTLERCARSGSAASPSVSASS